MSFGKIHHWLMLGSMLLMAGAGALALNGASTNFLHIGWEYVKSITVAGAKAIVPGLKAVGVATGNLLSAFGIKTGLAVVDPSTLTAAKGASHAGMAHAAVPPAAPPPANPLPSTPPPAPTGIEHSHGLTGTEGGAALKTKFSSAAEWLKSQTADALEQFKNAADMRGITIEKYAENFCDVNGLLAPAR